MGIAERELTVADLELRVSPLFRTILSNNGLSTEVNAAIREIRSGEWGVEAWRLSLATMSKDPDVTFYDTHEAPTATNNSEMAVVLPTMCMKPTHTVSITKTRCTILVVAYKGKWCIMTGLRSENEILWKSPGRVPTPDDMLAIAVQVMAVMEGKDEGSGSIPAIKVNLYEFLYDCPC